MGRARGRALCYWRDLKTRDHSCGLSVGEAICKRCLETCSFPPARVRVRVLFLTCFTLCPVPRLTCPLCHRWTRSWSWSRRSGRAAAVRAPSCTSCTGSSCSAPSAAGCPGGRRPPPPPVSELSPCSFSLPWRAGQRSFRPAGRAGSQPVFPGNRICEALGGESHVCCDGGSAAPCSVLAYLPPPPLPALPATCHGCFSNPVGFPVPVHEGTCLMPVKGTSVLCDLGFF